MSATRREGLVYGLGALHAAARGDRMMWALHRAALSNGIVPVIPAVAVAEGYRTEARNDRIGELLAGIEVEPFSDDAARRSGELAARCDTSDHERRLGRRAGGAAQLRSRRAAPAGFAHCRCAPGSPARALCGVDGLSSVCTCRASVAAPSLNAARLARSTSVAARALRKATQASQRPSERTLDCDQLVRGVLVAASERALGHGRHALLEFGQTRCQGRDLGGGGHATMMADGVSAVLAGAEKGPPPPGAAGRPR